MKTEINKPVVSKINWLAIVIALVNIVAALGYIPAEYMPHILTIVNTVGPAAIVVARTWFTAPEA